MPDGTPSRRIDAGSDRTEHLNSAIDRMMAGGPTPVLNDPELHELLQLATRLRDELPDDMPDPAFRDDLKHRLTHREPISITTRRPASPAPARFPWVAAISAIAAVMLAAISVGSLAIWLDNGDNDRSGGMELARTLASQQTATTIGFATMTAVTTEDESQLVGKSTEANEPIAEATEEPDTEQEEPEPTGSEAVPPQGASAVTTPLATPTTTSEPTDGPSLAAVPPVDSQHVEQGPRPAADGSGGQPNGVEYVLATDLPDLGSTADVYWLVPPRDDPESFVTTAAAMLEMDGEITSDAPMGRTVYHLFDDTGSFHWTPETGAFSVVMTDDETGPTLSVDDLAANAIQWLESMNYPVEQLGRDVRSEQIDDTTWLLNIRFDAMPEIGLGHHLGVTIFADSDGSIVEASGYWLELKQIDSTALQPADAIWEAVSSGNGYWTGGGIVEGGGEFRADTMRVTYVLTRDPSGDLVLQPVVQTSGEFVTSDGASSARISCFVQAARND